MITWHLEKRQIKDLKPHPKNPRQLSKDQERHLKTSLTKFGLSEKLIINSDNMIIGGHQRLSILKGLKEKEVECWVPDRLLTESEADELCLRLNRNHGAFDYDILANNFSVPNLLDWGFQVDELELIDPNEVESKDKEDKKKLTTCPSCGCEF